MLLRWTYPYDFFILLKNDGELWTFTVENASSGLRSISCCCGNWKRNVEGDTDSEALADKFSD